MEKDVDIQKLLNTKPSAAEIVEWKTILIAYINDLLLNDFQKLVQLLYRIDVDEKKLRELLRQNSSTDAAVIIADLLLQRLEEKSQTRDHFTSPGNIPEDEKW